MSWIVFIVTALTVAGEDVPGGALQLNLGSEQLVQSSGTEIRVPGFSVPSFVDWNNDGLNDLVVGQGSGGNPGHVRVYLNIGTQEYPQFSDFFYVQSGGSDLTFTGGGCLGCFPRVVYWDADDRKDLLVGQADGTVMIFLNTGTDGDPAFEAGQFILVGAAGVYLDVGIRATPTLVDWNNDYMKDLVIGEVNGRILIYLNCGCDGGIPPSFCHADPSGIFVQEDDRDLLVPPGRSSPVIMDLDGDGKKDILTGNKEGQLLFYSNVGTDETPVFSGFSLVDANGVPIDQPGELRSRLFVCDWTGDGYLDVLVGFGDGRLHLYQSVGQPGDINKDYRVDFTDLELLVYCLCEADCDQWDNLDLTGDAKVDYDDLVFLLAHWLQDSRIETQLSPENAEQPAFLSSGQG